MINSLISVVIAIAVFFSTLSQNSFSSLYHPYYLIATLFLPDYKLSCVEVWERHICMGILVPVEDMSRTVKNKGVTLSA